MRRLIFLILLFVQVGCFHHRYLVLHSDKPRQPERIDMKIFTLAWFVPVQTDINPEDQCPGSRIRMINMHDSGFDGLVCGATLFLICPHTVGIECEEEE